MTRPSGRLTPPLSTVWTSYSGPCSLPRTITPDDVRGTAPTLREAVEKSGWPTLAASRGKVFFILHDEGKLRDFYDQGHASLRGRVMFVRSEEMRDDAATLVMDSPRDSDIPHLVRAGFLIRTARTPT